MFGGFMLKIKNWKKTAIVCAFVSILGFVLLMAGCAPTDYSPSLKDAKLSTPSILEDGKLKVGVDFGNPPFAGDTAKSSGIDIDIAAAIADELGLNIEYVDVGSSPELALENNKVDMVMGMSKSTKITETWKSNPYIQNACALFAKSGLSAIPTKDGADKISAQMASQSALVAQAQFNVANIKLENSLSSSFESLAKGEVQYVAADTTSGAYYAKNAEMDVNIVALISKPSGFCIGAKKANTKLAESINSIIDTLSKNGTLSLIEKKWLGKNIDYEKIPLTPEANNQADASELEAGVYGEVSGTAKQS